ncbi:hypothetical protein GCM10007897_36000 [Sphingobium jiangsuense]|uniref:Uncharacterized protein n=1 Tax=Sphingobium jiangsuense TaxID=870476 RepID=A0A7W6BTX1_9SPHN|nr:hypothetical protein [Sphingobium jiangsuense]MBB3928748.1 hypothetical protein [Sphingobium jiangsuense]GLT02195.1 hypothetical protein GCM10007897_36000 [Sphingobium jiangsuense]
MDRRTLITAAALAPVAIAAPAVAGTGSPAFQMALSNYMEAFGAIGAMTSDTSEEEEDRLNEIYLARFQEMNEATPTTPREFVQKFHMLWMDGGYPQPETIAKMLADAKRIAP